MLRKIVLTAASLSVLGGGAAMAQTPYLPANYGEVTLYAGFSPDPHTVSLSAGGSLSASNLGAACRGYVTDAPDYKLNYTAGRYPLYIGALSAADTTIVINGPDGNWYCDDDSAGNLNPVYLFSNPQSGRYDIWVGTYSSGISQPATLHISELSGPTAGGSTGGGGGGGTPTGGYPDLSASPTYGTVNLLTGFTPDPHIIDLRAGGSINANVVDDSCRGFIATAPDFSVTYTAGTNYPLIISVAADTDTTLVINDPNGNWICDDDGGTQGLNPSLRFDAPSSGRYDIWVGTYGNTASQPARLHISELTTQ